MTELTEAQLNGIASIGDAARLAQLEGADTDRSTLLGSFLHTIGARLDTTVSALGIIKPDDFEAALRNWKIQTPPAVAADPPGERSPTLIELGKATYVGRIARAKLGLETLTRPGALAAAAAPPSSTTLRKVKMNQVLSQLDETEVEIISSAEQIRMFARYETLYGKQQRPHPNQEPSIEQLSGLKALVEGGQCPYADFAIFQPYAARIMKRIKFSGLILNKAGTLSQAEVYGPPDLDNWRACYDVWSNAMIMLDVMDLGPLQMYKAKVELLHGRYGESKVWALLYQADTRARLEHMPRIKLSLYQKHQEAVNSGGTTPYDDGRPWNYTLHTLANDDKFWAHEFVEPALIVLADAKGTGPITSDDAKIAGTRQSKNESAGSTTLPSAGSLSDAITVRPRNANRTGRVHDVLDGSYRSNRTGYQLCADFNAEKCGNTIQGSWCGNHSSLAHQCSRCLGCHPVTKCPHAETPQVGWVKTDKGKKGKGKGKKGRGRGGRAPY